jgi:hypothetical protein
MMLSNRLCFVALLVLFFGLMGCSSTGYSTKTSLVAPKTIRSPVNIPPELAPYAPRFVAMLEENGFTVGRTEDRRALELMFDFNGNPFNLRVSVGLWREGVPILSASATNSGWGTALARGPAVSSLADSSAAKFEIELKNLISRTQIVPDMQQ